MDAFTNDGNAIVEKTTNFISTTWYAQSHNFNTACVLSIYVNMHDNIITQS